MKRPNLGLIGVPESEGENGTKLENTLGYYPGELLQPSKTGQHSNSGNTENTTKIFLENPKTHNCQIHQGSNEGKILRAAREKGWYPQREASHTHNGSLGKNPASQKTVGVKSKEKNFQPEFHIQSN